MRSRRPKMLFTVQTRLMIPLILHLAVLILSPSWKWLADTASIRQSHVYAYLLQDITHSCSRLPAADSEDIPAQRRPKSACEGLFELQKSCSRVEKEGFLLELISKRTRVCSDSPSIERELKRIVVQVSKNNIPFGLQLSGAHKTENGMRSSG